MRVSIPAYGEKIRKLGERGFFHVMGGSLAIKAVAFISSIVVVRLLTKGEYASLAYVDNIYGYLYIFLGFGLSSAVLKYCVGDQEKDRAYFHLALTWGMGFQVAISVLTIVLFSIGNFPVKGVKEIGLALAIYPCFYYLISLLESMMRAEMLNKPYAWISFGQVLLLMVLTIAFVLPAGTIGIVWARYISAIAASLLAYKVLRNYIVGARASLRHDEKKSFLMFSLNLLVANVFSMLMPLNESFLVNNLIGSVSAISDYKIAALIPSQITIVTQSIMIYETPYFAREKEASQMWNRTIKTELLNFLLLGIVCVLGIILTPWIITIFYGEQYTTAIKLSYLLWIANTANAAVRMVPLNIIPLIGHPRFNMYVSVGTCLAHFAIDYLLIQTYGITGAAIASIFVYFISAGVYWAFLYRVTKKAEGDQ